MQHAAGQCLSVLCYAARAWEECVLELASRKVEELASEKRASLCLELRWTIRELFENHSKSPLLWPPDTWAASANCIWALRSARDNPQAAEWTQQSRNLCMQIDARLSSSTVENRLLELAAGERERQSFWLVFYVFTLATRATLGRRLA